MTDTVVGLDPDWITATIEVDGATPIAAEFAGFIGTGQMSRNARWHLDWGGADGPASVVVKIPSADEMVRGVSFEHGIYQKECEFYLSVRPLTDVADLLGRSYDACRSAWRSARSAGLATVDLRYSHGAAVAWRDTTTQQEDS